MYTITGGGSFTRTNIDQINANFSEVSSGAASGSATGLSVWVRPQSGNNNNVGTYDRPFASLSGASRAFVPGLTVYLQGVLFEEFSSPNVPDVSIVGVGNVPIQGTTGGVPNGAGPTWMSPSGGSGILAKINGQGWKIQGIYFNNAAAQPCIQALRSGSGDPPVDPDGSHLSVLGCKFTGADAGIQASGGCAGILIAGNEFFGFSGSGDCGVEAVTGAGVGTNYGWTIANNWFYNNANHVIAPLNNGQVYGNNFTIVGSATTATVALSLTGGASNSVYVNNFNRPLNSSPNATLFVGGTNDTWTLNYGTDGAFYGVPDNS